MIVYAPLLNEIAQSKPINVLNFVWLVPSCQRVWYALPNVHFTGK